MPDTEFPLQRYEEIKRSPSNFRLIERIPLTHHDTQFPATLCDPIGDELSILVIDVETTGLDSKTDRIIELGVVKARYSPSARCITEVIDAHSCYEDPGKPISAEITELTGITDADVAGKRIDDAWVASLLADDPVVLAHNAKFDAGFTHRRFPVFRDKRWGCTASEIAWKALGYEGRKLEYLLMKRGWFYEGHRASIDALATLWLLHDIPEAFKDLLDSIDRRSVVVRAFGSPFGVKEQLKSRGYRWHPGDEGCNKCWWIEVDAEHLNAEKAFLEEAYLNGSALADYRWRDARSRFVDPVA